LSGLGIKAHSFPSKYKALERKAGVKGRREEEGRK
jgi:hypothetical protein